MMKYLVLVVGVFLTLRDTSSTSIEFKEADWLSYRTQFNKTYANDEVESMRKIIFAHNKRLIDDFNANQSKEKGFALGLNDLSDASRFELQSLYKSLKVVPELQNSFKGQKFLSNILNDKSIEVPDEVDWRKSGRVTSVKNQGQYDSGWAFSATGALEGQELVRGQSRNSTIDLSAQNLIDCSDDAGHLATSFWAVKQEGGINDAESYPYEGKAGKCRFNKDKVVMTDDGAVVLPMDDENAIKEVVAKYGPVPTWVQARDPTFLNYKAGIFRDPSCNFQFVNHVMLVVGYGTDKQFGDYWILKNSWGTNWGEDGYMRLARNAQNQCGIGRSSAIPTFQ